MPRQTGDVFANAIWPTLKGRGTIWMYWATGTRFPALWMLPSHISGWNCLACSTPYQLADLLLRL